MSVLSLHTLKPAPRRRSKRLGRGNASGRGTYSGRGIKGQHARSGSKRIEARSLKSFFQRIPKRGGFRSPKGKAAVVTLDQLNKNFSAGSTVTPSALRRLNLAVAKQKIKIISTGSLSHALTIKGCSISAGARGEVIKAGGAIMDE